MSSPEGECRPLIVGIGASAGGLAAFKSFLANIPAEPNMAFVLVQHLAPDHKSLLVELLAAKSPIPVITASDGVTVKNNRVYVIPPDATLTIVHGVLALATPAPARQYRRPIDAFLESLAEDQMECAVGIILSGVGSDGSIGIRAIKEHGGLTLAQAEFDHHALSGMPSSANATGMVDHVMPVEAMGPRLIAYHAHLNSVARHTDSDGTRNDIRERLPEITSLLHAGVMHDFSGYKETTLVRRLQRRMLVLQLDNVDAYIDRLKADAGEATVLFQEVLIGVTEFFRDPDAFEALKALVIRPMLSAKKPNDTIRIWIAGCSTGEEVYSIAILLKEVLNELASPHNFDVKIFGTDIDARAISFARAGRYRKEAAGLSPERLARWFVQDAGDLCLVPEIREMCVFSAHSVIKDPPFSRIDLISCRNLLIYLDNDMQSRVARTFHYALKSGAYLFLGTSESIGRHGKSFDVLDKKNRVLQRNDADKRVLPVFQAPGALIGPHSQPERSGVRRASGEDRIDKSVRRVMEQHAPAYFVIDRSHEILRYSGSEARHYLEPSPGPASLHLFGNLQKTLRPAVRTALQRAWDNGKTVVTENLAVRIDGRSRVVTLIVEPIFESTDKERGICVVVFREASPFSASNGLDAPASTPLDCNDGLEKELNATRFQLRTASDELETSIEDMKSTTEEFQAVNEELQSSNEELETAKEEMQSINEELQTVNGELASKNELLTRLNSDLQNLLDSTQIATVFLDDDLRIRHFTPAMTGLFPLRDSDHGRPITEIVNLLSYDDLQRDVAEIKASHGVTLRDVALKDGGAAYQLRIQPYRTATGVIDGVVLTFVDITELKAAEGQTQLLSKELQHRTGNLIAVILSIANRTFSGDPLFDVARDVFSSRLMAIAKANALLIGEPGEGGALGDIVRGELASFSDRVVIEGPRLLLTPAATQGFALVVHELATNAAKYGAFANGAGKVSVKWSRTDHAGEKPRLAFRWQERGGPIIVDQPTRKGFGSTLLDRALDTSARPSVFDYAPEGLTYDLDVALDAISTPTWSELANVARRQMPVT